VIPSGADVHSFAPTTEAARRVAEADLVLVNGYRLEESALGLILENRGDVPLVVVSAGITPLAGGHDDEDEDEHDETPAKGVDALVTAEGDPHFWLDVQNAAIYVENIADALVAADPEHSAAYREREEAYLAELQGLDEEVHTAVMQIPSERRVLVVFHDAFAYFAQAYGFELSAALLEASPSQQTSAGDVARIVALVEESGVPAIYREPQFAAEALEAVAEETGARVLMLRSATFDGEVTSYVEMMRANADALLDGLGS
jgi:ABC-type Zn uptake system ZnuABC Zn-binding protein ZnuA